MIPPRHPKTPNTAVVLIPPQELWEPIQAIRRVHDLHVERWMPHVTLLFPFAPAERFAQAEPDLDAACRAMPAFRVKLARFDYFPGPKTAWLEPEPAESVRRLQEALQSRFPEFNDVARFPGGFRPHLSVGQGPAGLIAKLQEKWTPLEFEAVEVALIRRDGPEDPFRVDRVFRLGR
jgi:2'-5' RNA ligase